MMKKRVILILLLLSTPVMAATTTPQESTATEVRHAGDSAMIKMLLLRDDQMSGYLSVMRSQRTAYLAIPVTSQAQRLAIFEETIELLRPVLDGTQLAQFTAYTSSVIIEDGYQQHLSHSE